jgi:23S rRNA (cytidine2498-2'-O)-methyltransferase
MNITPLSGRVYQAVSGFEDHLARELGQFETWGPLFYAAEPPAQAFWHQNTWLNPVRIEFGSISDAATALRGIQRNWAPALFTQFRRGALIAEKLPSISSRPRPFPWDIPAVPMGAWTLLDEHTMIASARCSSPFPNGVIEFAEDKEGPPSRAYLKLWEALTLCGKMPAAGMRCLDAGASPGGWTWALAKLGAKVTAVDRAPLEDRVAAMAGVSFIKHDAFTLKPEDIGPVDWVFSDVICYPSRLYEWVEKWLASGLCKNFICTIKMQGSPNEGTAARPDTAGEPDFETPKKFAAITDPDGTDADGPDGVVHKVLHLYHNKHELTWIREIL